MWHGCWHHPTTRWHRLSCWPMCPKSPTLNYVIRKSNERLCPVNWEPLGQALESNGQEMQPEGIVGGKGEVADAWVISSQSFVWELNRRYMSRESTHEDKAARVSPLKLLGPSEKELFTGLCTMDMALTLVMMDFIASLLTTMVVTNSPQKAIGLLKGGCCHSNVIFFSRKQTRQTHQADTRHLRFTQKPLT